MRLPSSNSGELTRLVRAYDFTGSELGPTDAWSPRLRLGVDVCLSSRQPAMLCWGRALTVVYNDAFTPLLGAKHPRALGRPAAEVWSEVWGRFKLPLDAALTGGHALRWENEPLLLMRSGYAEETYFTGSFSPFREEDGRTVGVLCELAETTRAVLETRRLRALRDVAAQTLTARSAPDACRRAVEALRQHLSDLPFALLYVKGPRGELCLSGASGVAPGSAAAPLTVEADDERAPWPLHDVLSRGEPEELRFLEARLGAAAKGLWTRAPDLALALPLSPGRNGRPFACAVLGVSPLRPFDDEYRLFLEALAAQLSTSLSRAQSYGELSRQAVLSSAEASEQVLARQVVEATRDRLARLQLLTSQFARALTPLEVGEATVAEYRGALGADAALLALKSDETSDLELLASFGYPQEVVERWRTIRVEKDLLLGDCVLRREPLFVESPRELAARYPAMARMPVTHQAQVALPLVAHDRVLGAVGFSFVHARTFSLEERAFVVAVAQQCAQALERARLLSSERQALTEAREAIRLRDEFLSIASHELKTPLTSLQLQLQLTRRGLTNESPSPQRLDRALESSLRQVRRLASLVDDLLDVSRIQAGKLDFHFEPVRAAELVEEVAERFAEQLAAARCPLELHLDDGVEGLWDRSRIEQVLVNLLSNAVKYAPGTKVEVWVALDDVRAVLKVRDHGAGIRADQQERIFERFERANISKNVSGLGLGLFITRQIIHAHGGDIAVLSTPGGGAEFLVTLPALTPSRTVSAVATSSKAEDEVMAQR